MLWNNFAWHVNEMTGLPWVYILTSQVSPYIKGNIFKKISPNINHLHNEKLMLCVGESVKDQHDIGHGLIHPRSTVYAKYIKVWVSIV